jgi:hypothetical protein
LVAEKGKWKIENGKVKIGGGNRKLENEAAKFHVGER